MNIIDWIKSVFQFLAEAFEKMVRELLNRKEITDFMAEAGSIVREEVIKADELGLPGSEKHEVAFKAIGGRLEAAGKSFAAWLINWGIENVVASIRTKLDKELKP